METTELEAQVYDALINNDELMGMLPNDGEIPIYHHLAIAGDKMRYPILVYTTTNDVPVSYGDDEEVFHRVTIRISIITSDGEYSEINKLIREIMVNDLEFERENTVPMVDADYGRIILNCDYKKIIEA